MTNGLTKAERRERKKRVRMPVSGKEVFKLQKLMARRAQGPGLRGKKGRLSIRHSGRVNKPKHGQR